MDIGPGVGVATRTPQLKRAIQEKNDGGTGRPVCSSETTRRESTRRDPDLVARITELNQRALALVARFVGVSLSVGLTRRRIAAPAGMRVAGSVRYARTNARLPANDFFVQVRTPQPEGKQHCDQNREPDLEIAELQRENRRETRHKSPRRWKRQALCRTVNC